jgi:hypothetical protein
MCAVVLRSIFPDLKLSNPLPERPGSLAGEMFIISRLAERAAALDREVPVPADAPGLVTNRRQLNVTPDMAQNTTDRRSAIDARTTRHGG